MLICALLGPGVVGVTINAQLAKGGRAPMHVLLDIKKSEAFKPVITIELIVMLPTFLFVKVNVCEILGLVVSTVP